MLNLVIGAAAGGKSEYAEKMVMALPGERIYVATMEPFGAEAGKKIARHRALRAGKGFRTIERPFDLAGLALRPDWNVLVEDLPNLAANEFFSPRGGGAAAVLAGLTRLCETASSVTIVTGDIFSDGGAYDAGTRSYMEMLADLHLRVAEMADNIIEVICGIPCAVKGNISAGETVLGDLLAGKDAQGKASLSEAARVKNGEAQTDAAMADAEEHGMIYVTGPLASGKRDYVLRTLGIPEADAAFEVQELLRKEPPEDMNALAERLSALCAVTQTEVGAGVIPLSAEDREWREKAGRLACLLAERADTVIRMVCGVPVKIKESCAGGRR